MANIIEITDYSDPQLDCYARLTEAQLRNRLEPEKGIFIAESPKVILRALDAGYEPLSLLMERKKIDGPAKEVVARCGEIPLYTADRAVLEGCEMSIQEMADRGLPVHRNTLQARDWLRRKSSGKEP